MGRKKSYDRDEMTRKAMEMFWLHGFNGTSTRDLTKHMELNQYSLYAEYGSKQGLYESALTMYNEDIVTTYFGQLESTYSGIDDIRAVLTFFADAAGGPGTERGCFTCNAATEMAPHDLRSRELTHNYVSRVASAFERALGNAQKSGQLSITVNIVEEGQFFASVMLGAFVMLRSQVDPIVVRGSLQATLRHIDCLVAE